MLFWDDILYLRLKLDFVGEDLEFSKIFGNLLTD